MCTDLPLALPLPVLDARLDDEDDLRRLGVLGIFDFLLLLYIMLKCPIRFNLFGRRATGFVAPFKPRS